MADEMVGSAPSDDVMPGTVLILKDAQIVYTGPIKNAPRHVGGYLILLNPRDFDELESRVKGKRH